jgi:hypothetical protein
LAFIIVGGIIFVILFLKLNPLFRIYRTLIRSLIIVSLLGIFGTANGEMELYQAVSADEEFDLSLINIPLLLLGLWLLFVLILFYFGFFEWLKNRINSQNRIRRIANRTQLIMATGLSECSICLDAQGGISRKLPCNHCFHKACIDPWLIKEDSCPNCRAKLGLDLV